MEKVSVKFPHTDYSESTVLLIQQKASSLFNKYSKFLENIDWHLSLEKDIIHSKIIIKTKQENFIIEEKSKVVSSNISKALRKINQHLKKIKDANDGIHKNY